MKKTALLASIAFLGLSAQANAAEIITGASVNGPSGTVWNTTQDSFFTLFLQNPGLGNFLNPNDEAINFTADMNGNSAFLLAGDGFPTGTVNDSDPFYDLTVSFQSGNTLTGRYTPVGNVFVAGSSFASSDGSTYSLSDFSYRRNLGDAVSQFRAVPGGDGDDYSGSFTVSAVAGAIPEPATWAMMIIGFGAVGSSLRYRRQKVSASFA